MIAAAILTILEECYGDIVFRTIEETYHFEHNQFQLHYVDGIWYGEVPEKSSPTFTKALDALVWIREATNE